MTIIDPTPTAAEDEQVVLVVRIDTLPGVQAQLADALTRLTDATRREDRGVIRFEVGIDPTDDTRVVGYEIWQSQDALAEHSAKAHTQEFLTTVRDLVVDPAEPLRAERWRPLRRRPPLPTPRRPTRSAPPPPYRPGSAASTDRSVTPTCTT